jgi:hypothetical protein
MADWDQFMPQREKCAERRTFLIIAALYCTSKYIYLLLIKVDI